MQASKTGTVKLEAAKGNETNIKKLALKRIDCYASDRTAALYSMKRLRSTFQVNELPCAKRRNCPPKTLLSVIAPRTPHRTKRTLSKNECCAGIHEDQWRYGEN